MCLCQVTLLLAILHVLSAQELDDAQGCTANNQSTITITGTNGTIPRTPGYVPRNATCQWNITAPVGNVLRINIRASFHTPCGDDYLRIYDGPSDASDIMAEYNCNSSEVNGTNFFSSRCNLWLEIKTGINANSTAMLVSYEALEKQECSINSSLDAPQSPVEHNFSSPYYPQGYPVNMTCGWHITAPEDHIIMLQLTSRLSSSHSSKDSLEIYDVEGSELTFISQAWKMYSKSRFVYVVFKSDDKADGVSEQGIFVKYSAVKTVRSCSFDNSDDENMNIVLRNSSGVIQTPWYPHSYPYELINKCHWKIIAPKGKVVRIEFLSFRLYGDYAQITDRINGLNSRIVKIIGNLPSFNFYSTGNELSIMVKEDRGESGQGFIANYTSVPTTVSSGTCILNESSTVHMAGEGRSFSTPGYPSHPGKGTCSWNITVSPGQFVKVTFWEMKGSWDQNYAEVYEFTNSRWNFLGNFGQNSRENEFYSSGNNLFVRFTSPYSAWPGWPGGFIASYKAIEATPARYSCSKPTPYWWSKNVVTLLRDHGEFASFGYPLPYPNDVKCSWEIKAPVGYVVQLTFYSFHLQPSYYNDCWYDYVSIHSRGRWGHVAERIGKFCGSSLPSVIQSNYSTVYVNFLTDSAGRYPGFHASYKWLRDPAMGPCRDPGGGGNIIHLTGETGRLFSPLYPRNFADSISCTWVIAAPEGHFVRLKIKALTLGRDCGLSSLYIRDGQNSSSGVFKKYCDDQTFQTSMFSSGRYLRVEFRSLKWYHTSYVSKFDAIFETVKQVPASFSCTERNQVIELKSTSGSLASYNYPLPYDAYASCTWQFSMDSDYQIKLSFDFFNVSCNNDRVRVLDKNYCGSEKPPSVTLTTQDRIYFRSSGDNIYPGFRASYETSYETDFYLTIVGISFGALLAVCVVAFICYKCWKKNNRVPHTAVVHSLTNDVETEQEQDTVL